MITSSLATAVDGIVQMKSRGSRQNIEGWLRRKTAPPAPPRPKPTRPPRRPPPKPPAPPQPRWENLSPPRGCVHGPWTCQKSGGVCTTSYHLL